MAESRLARLKACYQKGGADLVLQVLSYNEYLPPPLFHYSVADIFELESLNQRALRRVPEGYRFAWAQTGDVHSLTRLAWGEQAARHRQRFQRLVDAQQVAKVEKAQQAIGFLQLYRHRYTMTRDGYRSLNLLIELGEDQAFIGYGFIHPDYRLKGIFPFLMQYLVERFPPATRFYTEIDRLNPASQAAHLRLGFRRISAVACRCALGLRPRWQRILSGADTPRALGRGTPQVTLAHLLAD